MLTDDLHYRDSRLAEVYDLDNPWAEDFEFYLTLTEAGPCRVLDLGCGTGTLCCALALRGHKVTGVDPAAPMLAIARRKLYSEKVEWIESRAQDYHSDRRFDLILMTGHAFQILLTDEEALAVLGVMREHLKEGGKVAFESRNPNLDWARVWSTHGPVRYELPNGQLRETLEITGEVGELISYQQQFEFPDLTLTSSSTLRFPSRTHIESLLARSGLAILDVFGDWDQSRFNETESLEMIFIAAGCGKAAD
jgi:SAM-dependent methyltransferase